MKRCAYCGRENPDGAIQCLECGTDEFRSTPTLPLRPPPPPGWSVVPLESPRAPLEQETAPPEPEPFVSEDEPSLLCTYCVFPNSPHASWCRKCGSPVSFAGIVGPQDAAQATIFMWMGALRGRPKLFVLITIWIYFLPAFLVNLLGALTSALQFLTGTANPVTLFLLCWSVVFGGAAFLMLFQVTRNYFTVPKIILED